MKNGIYFSSYILHYSFLLLNLQTKPSESYVSRIMARRIATTVVYWIVAILLVANILTSLDYLFGEALFIATMFLPGALALRYFLFKVSFSNRKRGLMSAVCVVAAILIAEIFLIIVANGMMDHLRADAWNGEETGIPDVTINPVFIGIIVTVLCVGDYLLSEYVSRKYRKEEKDATIRFNSNRSPVTLFIKDILYVESNDSETWVFARDGEKYRNKTPISHWEALLGDGFIRVHRSYLANRSALTRMDSDMVYLGETALPVSRKYKDDVSHEVSNRIPE